MKKHLWLTLCGSFLVSGCGAGSPNVAFSTVSLTFSSELDGETSKAQSIMLSNSGTAPLNITSIDASASFEETNTCTSPLVPGASCLISVTFTPGATGNLTGALSVTDNAAGSPQTVALSGTGTTGTLSGSCVRYDLPPSGSCNIRPAQNGGCPPGQPTKKLGSIDCASSIPKGMGFTEYIDTGSSCVLILNGSSGGGVCEVVP